MKWKKDLVCDIRTFTEYDDLDYEQNDFFKNLVRALKSVVGPGQDIPVYIFGQIGPRLTFWATVAYLDQTLSQIGSKQ